MKTKYIVLPIKLWCSAVAQTSVEFRGRVKQIALQRGVNTNLLSQSIINVTSFSCPGITGEILSIVTAINLSQSVFHFRWSLCFLNAHKEWLGSRCRKRKHGLLFQHGDQKGEEEPFTMIGKMGDTVYFQIDFKDHKKLMRWKDGTQDQKSAWIIYIRKNIYIYTNEYVCIYTYIHMYIHTQIAKECEENV